MLLPKRLIRVRQNFCKHWILFASYSSKSDSKNLGYYEIVKSNDVVDEALECKFGGIPNWELFAPKGYRFLLPGSVGPAWHEAGSMVPVNYFYRYTPPHKSNSVRLKCTVQECPVLLRKGVLELFPNNEIYTLQQLTIVTLMHKNDHTRPQSGDHDHEYYIKSFIWMAQDICLRLKSTGYWADFINPFSGRPYLSPVYKSTLYETDERFRCLGFKIRQKGPCKVIESERDKQFLGSLFTNAPANLDLFSDILHGD